MTEAFCWDLEQEIHPIVRSRMAALRRPPAVSQGVLRVLEALGPDEPPHIWAGLLQVPASEVRRALLWLEVYG